VVSELAESYGQLRYNVWASSRKTICTQHWDIILHIWYFSLAFTDDDIIFWR
jgi:hypothetical protein